MAKKETDLKKKVHFYESMEAMLKQFNYDIRTVGKEFEKVVYEYFDLKNPWDQTVLTAILTNILACMVLNAHLDGSEMEEYVIEQFKMNIDNYFNLAKEKGVIN